MTISTAERKAQEASQGEAIRSGAFYNGTQQTQAVDALIEDISGLSDKDYETVGGEVLALVKCVVSREPISISETMNSDRFKDLAQALGNAGASTATQFMEAMVEDLDGAAHVPYAGEKPIHLVLPFGVIPGYEQPKPGPMKLPALPIR